MFISPTVNQLCAQEKDLLKQFKYFIETNLASLISIINLFQVWIYFRIS